MMATGVINYAMAAYSTRVIMRAQGATPDERYASVLGVLINHYGLTRYQANKFVLSYLADLQLSRTR